MYMYSELFQFYSIQFDKIKLVHSDMKWNLLEIDVAWPSFQFIFLWWITANGLTFWNALRCALIEQLARITGQQNWIHHIWFTIVVMTAIVQMWHSIATCSTNWFVVEQTASDRRALHAIDVEYKSISAWVIEWLSVCADVVVFTLFYVWQEFRLIASWSAWYAMDAAGLHQSCIRWNAETTDGRCKE